MKSKLIMMMLLGVALLAVSASAKEVPTATRVDPADMPVSLLTPPVELVGNLNPPAFLLSPWFTGQESYAVMFNPSEQVTCEVGFQLTTVHMYLHFVAADLPVTFEVYADLGSAALDATGCLIPGDENCTGATYTVTIDVEGTYDIAIPIECECAYIYGPTGDPNIYYLSMHFPTPFTAWVVTDGVQAACTSYNDAGAGWEDLEPFFTEFGNINMFGEVICCSDPVATEGSSWGDLKSLFR